MDKNTINPKVTVLMPVYNGEKYLREAIESILNQTFTDFEFLIINDGSTDRSEKIIRSYTDHRIRLVNNEENLGVIDSLNKGLNLVTSKYIARMDADDISLPKRLSTQVKFMDKHPEIGATGTWVKIMNKKETIKHFSNSEKIKTNLLFGSSIVHPSILINKEKMDKYNIKYDKNYKHGEDYELWTRMIKYFPISNIKKVLLLYRVHDSNTGKTNSETQRVISNQIKKNQLKNNLDIDFLDITTHQSVYKPKDLDLEEYLDKKENWFDKLIQQNNKLKFYSEPEFSQVLSQRWLKTCSVNSNHSYKIWKRFWKSDLRKKIDWKEFENWKLSVRFLIKCLMK